MDTLSTAIRHIIGFAVRLVYFAFAMAWIVASFSLILLIFTMLAMYFQGYVSTSIAMGLAFAAMLVVIYFITYGSPRLAKVLSDIPVNIMDLGEFTQNRIVNTYIRKDLDKLSLAYALAEKGDAMHIQVVRAQDDPTLVQMAAHEQLHKIIKEKNIEKFNALLDVVSDIDATRFSESRSNSLFLSPLIVSAAKAGARDIVLSLIEHGADVNNARQDICNSALHKAVQHHFPDIVKLLLDHGADPNIRDHFKQSALWYGYKDICMVDVLLQHGADPNLLDIKEETVLDWCSLVDPDSETKQYIKLLKARGFKRGDQHQQTDT